ncbi:MAG: hypothetical protein WHS44_10575 [Fimbriimonadales bacterium]|nr:MAG: hypothetical protein KatS3mg018_2261 [Fimbriimonadales bacterium]
MTERPRTLTIYVGDSGACYFAGAFSVDFEPREGEVVLIVSQGRSRRRFAVRGELAKAIAKVRLAGEIVAHAELRE